MLVGKFEEVFETYQVNIGDNETNTLDIRCNSIFYEKTLQKKLNIMSTEGNNINWHFVNNDFRISKGCGSQI